MVKVGQTLSYSEDDHDVYDGGVGGGSDDDVCDNDDDQIVNGWRVNNVGHHQRLQLSCATAASCSCLAQLYTIIHCLVQLLRAPICFAQLYTIIHWATTQR